MKQPKPQCAAVENDVQCPLPARAGGYCNKHYHRWYETGKLTARPMGSIQTCQAIEHGKICGLVTAHKGLGLCKKHYGRHLRHGTTDANPLRNAACREEVEPGKCCGRPVKAQGRCHMHLMRVYRLRERLEFEAYAREHSQ